MGAPAYPMFLTVPSRAAEKAGAEIRSLIWLGTKTPR